MSAISKTKEFVATVLGSPPIRGTIHGVALFSTILVKGFDKFRMANLGAYFVPVGALLRAKNAYDAIRKYYGEKNRHIGLLATMGLAIIQFGTTAAAALFAISKAAGWFSVTIGTLVPPLLITTAAVMGLFNSVLLAANLMVSWTTKDAEIKKGHIANAKAYAWLLLGDALVVTGFVALMINPFSAPIIGTAVATTAIGGLILLGIRTFMQPPAKNNGLPNAVVETECKPYPSEDSSIPNKSVNLTTEPKCLTYEAPHHKNTIKNAPTLQSARIYLETVILKHISKIEEDMKNTSYVSSLQKEKRVAKINVLKSFLEDGKNTLKSDVELTNAIKNISNNKGQLNLKDNWCQSFFRPGHSDTVALISAVQFHVSRLNKPQEEIKTDPVPSYLSLPM